MPTNKLDNVKKFDKIMADNEWISTTKPTTTPTATTSGYEQYLSGGTTPTAETPEAPTNTTPVADVTPTGDTTGTSGTAPTTTPTFTPGWNKDATEYTDGAGELWHWKNEQLYNSNDISWEDVQSALKARGLPGEEAPTRPLVDVTPTVTQPIGYGSYLSGANGSGYGEYLANAGKGVQAGYDQAVAAARRQYEQNRANYGASGESLARAGLTGSGYGDYLEGKAFSAMQQNIGAAETARAASYADYLTRSEESAASLAAYLAGEEAAAKENLDLAINSAVASAIKNGSKYYSVEDLNEIAAQAGVVFDEATMAAITERLAAQGITVADRATVENYNNTEAANAAVNAIVSNIYATGAKVVSEEDIAALVMQSTVPITAEAIKSGLAGFSITVKPQAEIDGDAAAEAANAEAEAAAELRAANIAEIKEFAKTGVTIDQIKNKAKNSYGIELSDEELADISAYVKSETGSAPKTTEEATNLSIRSWMSEYQNEYGVFADSETLERALKNNGVTDEKQIEAAKAIYYDDNYYAMDKAIRDWNVEKNGSVDDIVSAAGAMTLNDMIGKTITAEQAAELQKQVSTKLAELFNAAIDSGNMDDAQKILGVSFENTDNWGGEMATRLFAEVEAGNLDKENFGQLMEKIVDYNVKNFGYDGFHEDAFAQSVLYLRDLIGEDEDADIRNIYQNLLAKYADSIKSLTMENGSLRVNWGFDVGFIERSQNGHYADLAAVNAAGVPKGYTSSEAGLTNIKAPTGTLVLNKDGDMYVAMWNGYNGGYNTWYKIDEENHHLFGAKTKEQNVNDAAYIVLKALLESKGKKAGGITYLENGYFTEK